MAFYNGPINPDGFPFYGYGDHLLTTSQAEVEDAQNRWGYTYEHVVGYVYPANVSVGPQWVPLYRLASENVPCGDHFYTTRQTTVDAAKSAGYKEEGAQCTVAAAGSSPPSSVTMYRLYLSWNGDHLYSENTDEIKDAIDNHDYEYDSDHEGRAAFRVVNRPATGLIPLHRLVRNKEWE